MPPLFSRRAFTLVELLAALGLSSAGFAAVLVVANPDGAKPPAGPLSPEEAEEQHDRQQQLKDATQVRAQTQALFVWANNNGDRFPFPSQIDAENATVNLGDKDPRTKDTTANIYSVLIWNGMVAPEMLIAPSETNPNIRPDEDYHFTDPPSAADPARANWDPAFAADFTAGKTGNVSYAHLQPAGGRFEKWSLTFQQTEPIVSTRGPEITEVIIDKDGAPTAKFALARSNTFALHRPKDAWSGNVGYADGHVDFTQSVFPADVRWTHHLDGKISHLPDALFFDEPADFDRANAYLGIFTKAGPKPADYSAIWD